MYSTCYNMFRNNSMYKEMAIKHSNIIRISTDVKSVKQSTERTPFVIVCFCHRKKASLEIRKRQ